MSYSSEVLADSPLGYWRLGDAGASPSLAIASSNFGPEPPTNAIDGIATSYWTTNGTSSGWLRLQYASPAVLAAYSLRRRDDIPARNPKGWTFEGSNDGTSWAVLDTRSGITWPTSGETKSFTFTNSTAYLYYRLNVTANNGDGYLSVAELTTLATADFSGGGHAGIARGPVTSGAGLLAGDSDRALTFANGGSVLVPYGAWMTASALTVEAVVQTTQTGFVTLIDRDDENGNLRNFQFRLNSGKIEYVTIGGGAGVVTASSLGVVNDGKPHHVAATYDASNIRLYIDGALVATQAAAGALPSAASPLTMGTHLYGSGASWFVGTMDEVAYYGTALGGARIAAHAAAVTGSTVTTTGTVSATLPSLTGSASGTVTQLATGSVAGILPSLTGSITGTPITTGASNGTLPSLTGSVSGTVAGLTGGTVDGTLPALSGSVAGDVTGPTTGTIAGTLPALTGSVTDARSGAVTIPVCVKVETGPLTLLHIVALPGVEIPVGVGLDAGSAQSVIPLPGVSVEIGCSLIARPVAIRPVDARGQRPQWRYVITDLDNTPLGELTDLQHDPVEDGVGDPATMDFTLAVDSPDHALIKPIERQCQVWDGDDLRLRGPILPGRPSDDGSLVTYTVHDPSWFWRDGRRVITRIPQRNLLHNGDFKSNLAWWTRGYDRESKPAAAPNVRVVSEDFADDTDGLDPIKAAEIVGVESYTESELSSNAVFWPNLATFRPGGVASIEKVADDMPTTAGLKVTVIGHTANDGTGNGLGLSLRRANAAAAIIKRKRPGAVIATKGVGYYDPKPGFPIGSQAQRRVVIQYEQTITGESLQWMKQTVEVTQPKEARYPLVLTLAAMLKVADDWSVEGANMMTLKALARRKTGATPPKSFADALAQAKADYTQALADLATVKADNKATASELESAREKVTTAKTALNEAQWKADSAPWDEQLGVGSSSISDTDPVDRWIPQTAEVTIPADGRAYLVDVYLYAPAALARYTAVGLFPEEMLYFWGKDQALIFKGIMEHIQDPAFGHGDLGVLTRAPLTGIRRDREFAFRDLTPADTALDGLTAISRGIEWDTVCTPTTTTATTFYPRQGKTVDYVLALGGNVARAVPANTRDVGSNVIAQAQGLGSYRAVAYARDGRRFGGTLLERVVTAEQETPLNELRETAKAELFWARSSTPAYWVDIDPESIEDVLANTAKGDTVRLILDYPEPVDRLARIVRRQIHPDSLRLMLAFEEV